MLTLGQVKSSSVANVASLNPSDPQFAQIVSDADEQLSDIGNWWGTVKSISGWVFDNVIAWPDRTLAVLAMRVNGMPVNISNYRHEFIPYNRNMAQSYMNDYRRGNCSGVVVFDGTTPVFYPPSMSNPFAIQATADNPADYGKTITIYGLDTNGHQVAASQLGVNLTLAAVAPNTTQIFSHISGVVKDITVGNVRLWVWNPLQKQPIMVANYSGSQTSPQYPVSRMRIRNSSIEALVKYGFRPVVQDSDILTIDCLDAIKCQVQSIKSRDGGDPEKGLFYEKMAIRRLNMQLRSRFPMEQFDLAFRPFGDDTLQRQKIGTLI